MLQSQLHVSYHAYNILCKNSEKDLLLDIRFKNIYLCRLLYTNTFKGHVLSRKKINHCIFTNSFYFISLIPSTFCHLVLVINFGRS